MNYKRNLILSLLFVSFIAASMIILTPSVKAQPSGVWVDDDFTSATPGWGTTHFDKIQDGINAVAPSGMVHVADGTYVEQVLINKGLSLLGQSEVGTILDGSTLGTYTVAIEEQADNVEIRSFTVKNYWIGIIVQRSTGGVLPLLQVDDVKLQHITVRDCDYTYYLTKITNLIVDDCDSINGVKDGIWAAETPGVRITNCHVINSGDHGIWAGYYPPFGLGGSDNSIITDNLVDGAREAGISFVASDGAIIARNTVTNAKGQYGTGAYSIGAISLKDGVSNVIVRDNKIYGNIIIDPSTDSGRGIGIDGSWSNIDINHNFIENNAGGGIKVMGTGTGYFRCNFNCISDNTGYGAENTIGSSLDFENNYWGHHTGPYHLTTNPSGQGDQVSDNVDYDPWLTSCPLKPVGGIWVPINKTGLLLPLISYISFVMIAAASMIYVRRRKKQQN